MDGPLITFLEASNTVANTEVGSYRISRFRVPRMSTFVRPAAVWSIGILVWDTSTPLELRLTFGLYDLFGKISKLLMSK